ncbi:MAG: ribonuclease R [Phycisphaerae bacterium]|nr:ribonuclease R [Phycisphaerae bacterium]MDD5381451.1 ribonuclease R [Phycisphaerae bacterium]
MSEIFKRQIIKFLKHRDYTPLKLAPLAKALGVSPEDYPHFKLAFEELRRAGHVMIGTGNLVSLPPLSGRIIGTFRANPRGFGFVIPLEHNLQGDLFIPPNATAEAMTGDIVAAKVVQKGERAGQMRYSGNVVEILERAQNKIVGTLVKRPEGWMLEPDGKGFTEPIGVDDVTAKNAREKDKVVVEILTWPSEKYLARGVIIEVLGRAGQYESEIRSVIHQYHLPGEFEADCIEQARKAAAEFKPEATGSREDITGKVVITIDPPDAKDFDDAISIEKNTEGNLELGIHIADVSFFVTADSPLDVEAKNRGNSAYLPGRTIPMLPEILSNGICSLQPGQRRFCKSAYITYDREGNILGRRFANSVINSMQRLTYEDADKALKGHTKEIKPEVIKLLKDMEMLGRVIERRRERNGMIHLDLPEIELVMDKSGRVVDARPADTSYPHTIIEMFMVEANEAVASLLDRINVPFMRRIHPDPDALGMKSLSQLVRAFGVSVPQVPDRAAIQKLLAAVKEADCSFAVNIAVLRSFEKAQYSPLNIGHYALASTHYCHFTSPIRRYADLLVHRLLEYYLQNRLDAAKGDTAEPDLTEIGKHLTFTEQRADDAENELKAVLILQMLSKRTGEELDCVVTGLTNFGVFVQSQKFGIDGLIMMEDLGGDVWKYNQKAQCVTGMRSGENIRLGKAIKVRIVSVNVPARQLKLVPVKPLVTPASESSFRRRGRDAAKGKDRGTKTPKKARRREKRRRSRH